MKVEKCCSLKSHRQSDALGATLARCDLTELQDTESFVLLHWDRTTRRISRVGDKDTSISSHLRLLLSTERVIVFEQPIAAVTGGIIGKVLLHDTSVAVVVVVAELICDYRLL